MGAGVAAGRRGVHEFVAADMGGTSYDVCPVKRSARRGHRLELALPHTNLPMVDIHSVGAGGGSIVCGARGALLIGPGLGRLGAWTGLLLQGGGV